MVVEGDMDKIGIALRNLIQNALTFTNEGGKVKVKGEVVPGYVKITVMDNGIGIPPEELGSIFTRFYQVEKHLTRKHGGVGLGLSIAKEMVELHGGNDIGGKRGGHGQQVLLHAAFQRCPGQRRAARFPNRTAYTPGSLRNRSKRLPGRWENNLCPRWRRQSL